MPYAVIPETAIAALPKLSGSAVKIMNAIASFMPGRATGCYPSIAAIGERAGINREKTISAAIKELTAAGVMVCERRRRQTNYLQWEFLDQAESAGTRDLDPAVSAPLKSLEPAEIAPLDLALDPAVSVPVIPAVSAPRKETRKDTTSFPQNNEKPPSCSAAAATKTATPKPPSKAPKPKVAMSETGFVIPDAIRQTWTAAYPRIDIDHEAAKAFAWCMNNPRKAPKKDYGRFLNSWLGRARPAADSEPEDNYSLDPKLVAMIEEGLERERMGLEVI